MLAVARNVQVSVTKEVRYTNKKGNSSTKNKTVQAEVDVTRKLQWSVMIEANHLVMVPRLLRTTHAHSPYFRVSGEEVRKLELEAGQEERKPLVGERLIAYSPLLPYIIGAAGGSWQKDKFWALCQLLGCPLIDRTGKLACPLRFKVMHPIPALGHDPGPLPELMRARARLLLDIYVKKGQTFGIGPERVPLRGGADSTVESERLGAAKPQALLQILWSGGIDTTAVICAFLQVATDEEKKHLLVRYCARSKEEYPLFFESFIPQLPSQEIEGHVRDAFEDGFTVTGDPADMLMGTLVMGGAFKGRYTNKKPNTLHFALEKPWRDVIPQWLCQRGLLEPTKKAKEDWLLWMDPFVSAAPIPIVSVFDWLWWVTYACKYQHDLMRVFYNRKEIPEDIRNNVVNFFESEEFHRWSFHHHEEKMPDKRVWASYKMPLKDFIFEHTGDANYRAHKMKVQSVRNSWGFELGITDQWEVISFGKFSVSLRRLQEKYGNDLDTLLQEETRFKKKNYLSWSSLLVLPLSVCFF